MIEAATSLAWEELSGGWQVLDSPPQQKSTDQQVASHLLQEVLRSAYARYGLAIALRSAEALGYPFRTGVQVWTITEEELREALQSAIETGLGKFRIWTLQDPLTERELTFEAIPLSHLRKDAALVQSQGLANRGIYIRPTVVTTDGNAKDTFKNAEKVLADIVGGKPLDTWMEMSRSFAPTTAKINNGSGSQTPPRGTLLEAACALITTITPLKAAAMTKGRNTALIPDLDLDDLGDFLEIFESMVATKVAADLNVARNTRKQERSEPQDAETEGKENVTGKNTKKPKKQPVPEASYRRPKMFAGNYPYAPQDSESFGPIGLLAAIGRWAAEVDQRELGTKVLEKLSSRPMLIVSYDAITQVNFGHHVVALARDYQLSRVVNSIWNSSRLHTDAEKSRTDHTAPGYKHLYRQASHFFQFFTVPAFKDFLAVRATHSRALEPIVHQFFTGGYSGMPIREDVVASAGAIGTWLNRTAWFVAYDEVGKSDTAPHKPKVKAAKAKILLEFESAAMGAKEPLEVLYRITTRCGRFLKGDVPAEGKAFMDAVASGELSLQEAQWLLLAYMRLRSPETQSREPEGPAVSVLAVDAEATAEVEPGEGNTHIAASDE